MKGVPGCALAALLAATMNAADLKVDLSKEQAGKPPVTFGGPPLAADPNGAAAVFYGLWPGLFVVSGILSRRGVR